MRRFILLLAWQCAALGAAQAAGENLPAYQPAPAMSGVLRVAGNSEMAAVVARWAVEFRKHHPAVSVETHLTGSDTGIAALYTGHADVALLGRSPTLIEIQAFEWIFHYKPAQAEILTGSLNRAGQSPALVVFVHRDNPLRQLTMAQLDAIFGTEHRLAPADIRSWGQLGLTGDWANRPLRLYAPDSTSGTGRFFRHAVLNDSRMMNWAQLTEFTDTVAAHGETHDAGRQVIAALIGDPSGLAISSLDFSAPEVRPVPLAITDTVGPVTATRETLIDRSYPLTRVVLACYNRKPGTPTDPLVREFLRYVLSREGQEAAAHESSYLPLAASSATLQIKNLD